MQFSVEPIGFVKSVRQRPEDDFWGGEQSCIALEPSYPAESLKGLADFSHAEVLFLFHQVDPLKIVIGARHPRNNEIDIKPVMIEFLPRENVRQPIWATELMGNHWRKRIE